MTTLATLAASPEFTSHINEHFRVINNVVHYAYKDFSVPLAHIIKLLDADNSKEAPFLSRFAEALILDILSWGEGQYELLQHTNALLSTKCLTATSSFHLDYKARIYYSDIKLVAFAFDEQVSSKAITAMLYKINVELLKRCTISYLPPLEVKRTTKIVNGTLTGRSFFSLADLRDIQLRNVKCIDSSERDLNL